MQLSPSQFLLNDLHIFMPDELNVWAQMLHSYTKKKLTNKKPDIYIFREKVPEATSALALHC